jgi:hypothetical protein
MPNSWWLVIPIIALSVLLTGCLFTRSPEGHRAAPMQGDAPKASLLQAAPPEVKITENNQHLKSLEWGRPTTQIVEMLQSESPQESLSLLSDLELFYWPGAREIGMSHDSPTLSKGIGWWDVDTILSNRRFLKVYRELMALPDVEATDLINAEIKNLLPVYSSMFEETWKKVSAMRANNPIEGKTSYGVGPSLMIINNPDHSPTLVGARLKILGLMIVAGNKKLPGTSAAIKAVVSEATRQRERFYKEETGGAPADRLVTLQNCGLYNRQILATALLAMENTGQSKQGDSWESHELTYYDAATTPYDFEVRNLGITPVDFSKGKQIISVHAPLDDVEFDAIAARVR